MKPSIFVLVALAATVSAVDLRVHVEHLAGNEPSERIAIRYTIHNQEDVPVMVLKWGTPFETFTDRDADAVLVDDPLDVIFENGPETAFLGIKVRRVDEAPLPSDYVTIAAHDSASIEIDVSASYDMRASGSYHIVPHSDLQFGGFARVRSRRTSIRIDPADIEIVHGLDALPVYSEPGNVTLLGVDDLVDDLVDCGTFSQVLNCNGGEVSLAQEAAYLSSRNVPEIPVYNSDNPGDPISTRWFGLSGLDLGAVRVGFQRIQRMLCRQGEFTSGARLSCDYTCNYLAYVYPTDPTYTVYVCPPHFRSPMIGYYSQVGTVVHEISHFRPVHNSPDVIYGCRECESLAITNPTNARRNADNLCYAVEFSGVLGPIPQC